MNGEVISHDLEVESIEIHGPLEADHGVEVSGEQAVLLSEINETGQEVKKLRGQSAEIATKIDKAAGAVEKVFNHLNQVKQKIGNLGGDWPYHIDLSELMNAVVDLNNQNNSFKQSIETPGVRIVGEDLNEKMANLSQNQGSQIEGLQGALARMADRVDDVQKVVNSIFTQLQYADPSFSQTYLSLENEHLDNYLIDTLRPVKEAVELMSSELDQARQIALTVKGSQENNSRTAERLQKEAEHERMEVPLPPEPVEEQEVIIPLAPEADQEPMTVEEPVLAQAVQQGESDPAQPTKQEASVPTPAEVSESPAETPEPSPTAADSGEEVGSGQPAAESAEPPIAADAPAEASESAEELPTSPSEAQGLVADAETLESAEPEQREPTQDAPSEGENDENKEDEFPKDKKGRDDIGVKFNIKSNSGFKNEAPDKSDAEQPEEVQESAVERPVETQAVPDGQPEPDEEDEELDTSAIEQEEPSVDVAVEPGESGEEVEEPEEDELELGDEEEDDEPGTIEEPVEAQEAPEAEVDLQEKQRIETQSDETRERESKLKAFNKALIGFRDLMIAVGSPLNRLDTGDPIQNELNTEVKDILKSIDSYLDTSSDTLVSDYTGPVTNNFELATLEEVTRKKQQRVHSLKEQAQQILTTIDSLLTHSFKNVIANLNEKKSKAFRENNTEDGALYRAQVDALDDHKLDLRTNLTDEVEDKLFYV